MNPHHKFCHALALAGLAASASAQIFIVPEGVTVTFDSAPPPTEWSTRNPGGAAGDIITPAALEAAAKTNLALLINLPLTNSDGSVDIMAGYHTNQHYVYTRPATYGYSVLLATLHNITGSELSAITVSYDLITSGPSTEQVYGHRLYWSQTGEAGSWTFVGACGRNTAGTTRVSFGLDLGAWADDAGLYLMWVDDNANTTDVLYGLDNVSFSIGLPALSCTLAAPAPGTSFVANQNLTATAVAAGLITNVEFYVDASATPAGATVIQPYSVYLSFPSAGVHTLYAKAYDGLGAVAFSQTNSFTITNAPLVVTLTSPANGATLNLLNPVTFAATTVGTLGVTGVAFYTNNVLCFWTNATPCSNLVAGWAMGTNTVYALATNSAGQTAYSRTNSFTMVFIQPGSTNWTAYNDHNRGPLTAANVATYSIPNNNTPQTVGGPLTNFATGAVLPAGVAITTVGTVNGTAGTSFAPTAGTPADLFFSSKADWTNSALYFAGGSGYTGSVTITFTNLSPAKKYYFRGAVVRGSTYAGRWTQVTLANVTNATPAHQQGPGSPGIVTNGWAPYGNNLMAGRQAAFNAGQNLVGDLIGWDEIVPAGTSFSIICSNWRSVLAAGTAVPGGTIEETYSYALNALALTEAEAGSANLPATIISPMQNQSTAPGNTVTFTVGAVGAAPLTYFWYTNNLLAQMTANGSFSPAAPITVPGSNYLCTVIVSNSFGLATNSASAWGVLTAPTVVLTSPWDGQVLAAPATVMLQANAGGGSGTVAGVGFFSTTSGWLGTAVNAPYASPLSGLPAGRYQFYAMVTNSLGAIACSATNSLNVLEVPVGWVAYVDHLRGGATSNYTAVVDWNANNGVGDWALTNLATGLAIPSVGLHSSRVGTQFGTGTLMNAPATNTPAWNLFSNYCSWDPITTTKAIFLRPTESYTLTFTNLDPAKRYCFRGTLVRGSIYTGRWLLASLQGAAAFDDGHTAGVWTNSRPGTAPFANTLTNGQALLDCGTNQVLNGDVVGWTNLVVGTNGQFSIKCEQWTNTCPNGVAAQTANYAYLFTAIRLEEQTPVQPPLQVGRSGNQVIIAWPGSSLVLQQTSVLLGSGATRWTNVVGNPQSPYTNQAPAAPQLFYRLGPP